MYATHLYKAIIIRHYIWFFFRNVRHYICGLINSVLWRDHRTQAVCRAPGPGVAASSFATTPNISVISEKTKTNLKGRFWWALRL